MNYRYLKFAAALAILGAQATARAEDIDLFVQPAPTATDIPNILFMVDNTANWNPMFASEMSALVNTFNSLAVNTDGSAKFRVGVMFATETGDPNDNNSGAYVRAAIRPMTGPASTNYRALYATMFNTLDKLQDKGNAGKSGLQMVEAYRYLSGGAVYAGNNKVKTDFTGNTGSTWKNGTYSAASKAAMAAIYGLPGNALDSVSATQYNSPIPDGYCGKNYIIYISNGANQQSSADDAAANAALLAAGGSITQIPISPTGSQSNPSDEWARFLHKSPLGVVMYTLDVDAITTGQGPGWTALLKSMASASEGRYFSVSSSGSNIGDTIGKILAEIQAVNSVFASVSLPVSVNTEGTYLNQVYIGMFRPDRDGFPRWTGNLKQYKLGYNPSTDTSTLRLLDADGNRAISAAGTGFITPCARSYWTPTSVDSYWAFRPQGNCTAVANSMNSNYPDGDVVEKGAQAYKLRSTTTRSVKTCSSTFSSCTSLVDFNSSNVSKADLGNAGMSDTEYAALLRFARGFDVDDENINGVTATTSPAEMRPSVHGDVVHSRPIAINFGTDVSPKVVVFYGANDGVLRGINGNQTASINSSTPGSEMWAFVPPQFDAQFKPLRDNTSQIKLQTIPTGIPKPYGIDGPIAAYTATSGSPATISTAWIYAAMRRGGRVMYAFDVSDIAAASPGPPTLKWKIGCPNNFPASGTVSDAGCDAAFTQLGQTWSAPKVFKTAGYPSSGTPRPMLIFGGGYDPCEDIDASTQPSCVSTEKGNRIYVMDADDPRSSGTIATLKTFVTDAPVAGDVFVVPDYTTGMAKWAYAADLAGNVYRISGATANAPFGTSAPSTWTITKIASLGCNTPSASCWPKRKFMFAPDVVESSGTYYVLLGSGDREKPLRAYTNALATTNYIFSLKDNPTSATWLTDEVSGGGACGAALLCLDSLAAIPLNGANPTEADLASKKGWYLGLNEGEQVVTSAITIYGTTTISTQVPANPAAGSCTSNLGTARVYNINYRYAGTAACPITATGCNPTRSAIIDGGGLPPSAVAGQVKLEDGRIVPFCIGCEATSPLEGDQPTPPITTTQPKSLTYWFIQK